MAKYKLTEAQLEMIMGNMVNERYVHPDDPENFRAEPKTRVTTPSQTEGPFKLVAFDGKEYLLINSENNELYYTIGDAFDGDIYTALQDYLELPQTGAPSPQGKYGTEYTTDDDWESGVTDEQLAQALPHLVNHLFKNNMLDVTANAQDWEAGKGQFLLITRDLATHADIAHLVLSDELLAKVKEFFSQGI